MALKLLPPPTEFQDPPDASVGGLGRRLRQARELRGVTVRGLARAVGVSASMISQIEHGRVMPSVGTLYAIASELGLMLDDLFHGGGERPPGPAPGEVGARVRRRDGRTALGLAAGVRWEMLTSTPQEGVEFVHVVYDVGGASSPEDRPVRHGGTEYAYLMSGRLGVRIGAEEFVLEAGDAISFDARTPHRLWTVGDQPAVAIWLVLGRHGDARGLTRGEEMT